MLDLDLRLDVLRAVAVTGELGQDFDAAGFARVTDTDPQDISEAVAALVTTGLLRPRQGDEPVTVTHAGGQFLARDGQIAPEITSFMPTWLDDLLAREALYVSLMTTAHELLDEIGRGHGAQHLADVLFHPTWADMASEMLAVRFVGAAGMLSQALVHEVPPTTIAEEVLFATVAWSADGMLAAAGERDLISPEEQTDAQHELLWLEERLLLDGRVAAFLGAYFRGHPGEAPVRASDLGGRWFASYRDALAVPGPADAVIPEPSAFVGMLSATD